MTEEQILQQISFGGEKSPHDYRDVPFSAVVASAGLPEVLPDSYFPPNNLIDKLPVWSQRQIGACTAHAWGKTRQKSLLQSTGQVVRLSPRFPYAIAKNTDGVAAGNQGTYPRLIAKIMQKTGICTEATLPNDTTLQYADYINLASIPSAAYDEARQYQINGYAFPNAQSLEELKQAIIYAGEQTKEIVMLVRLGREWWTDRQGNPTWNGSLLAPIRPPKVVESGHEIYPYAYELDHSIGMTKVWFFNSWTEQWGFQGKSYFYWEDYRPFIDEVMTAADLPADMYETLNFLPPAQTFKHNFHLDISLLNRGDEVKALQNALMIDGEFNKDLYSELLVSKQLGFYGDITRQAVLAFQVKYAVDTPANLAALRGKRVGPKTRAKLNQLFNQ